MKKTIPFLFLVLAINFTFAQKKPKIQGSKNVVENSHNLTSFKVIELTEDIEVTISQGEVYGYTLKCDDNLVDFIKIEIRNDVLKIYTTHEIIRPKALEINLTVAAISAIILKEKASITCRNKLKLDTLSFTAFDDAKYDIDIFAETSSFQLYKNTKGKIQLKGESTKLVLNENAFMEGSIVLENLEVIAKDRTDIEIEGDVRFLTVMASNSADVDLKKLSCSTIKATTSDTSEVYLFSNDEIKLYNSDKSKVYIYGNPSISIEGLKDDAQIIKKSK